MNFQSIIIFASIPIYLIVVYLCRKYRQWLLYYLFGSFGFTLIVTYSFGYFHIDDFIVAINVFHTNILANIFGIPSQALSFGRLQLPMKNGWSILQVGIECSAVLEMSALAALIIFYPAFSRTQKIIKIIFGLAATYIINIFRMLIIVAITYFWGVNFVFIAHAVVGRLFFFILIIVLYWFLITKPTVRSVGAFLKKGLKVTKTTILKEPPRSAFINSFFMIAFIIVSSGFATASFMKRDEWKTAFEKRILPISQKISIETEKELEIKMPDIKETVALGKVMNLTPEVLGEKFEKISLIPAITVLSADNKWLCQIRNPEEHMRKEFYYLWFNTKDSQKIILGPTKEFLSEISGSTEDDWQCFVSENKEELDKIEINQQKSI